MRFSSGAGTNPLPAGSHLTPPQIFERGNRLKLSSVGLKEPLCTLPHLLFCHLSELSLRPFGALSGGKMLTIKRLPGHQHVTLGAPWVGEVSLLQYNHGVLEMLVIKVDYPLSQTTLNRSFPWPPDGQEIHLISAWLSSRGHSPPITSSSCCLPVLHM